VSKSQSKSFLLKLVVTFERTHHSGLILEKVFLRMLFMLALRCNRMTSVTHTQTNSQTQEWAFHN